MNCSKSLLSVLIGLSLSAGALAQVSVSVNEPWVRATVPQQKATGAFMQLTAKQEGRLVAASSPVAGVVEIHEMVTENNIMKMRAIPGLALPAGKTIELKPGGYHVMLMDLKSPISEGAKIPMTLVIEGKDGKRESIEVSAAVRPLNSGGTSGHSGHTKH